MLAWTRDTDGNAATHADQRIAAAVYNPATQQFSALTLLTGPGGGLKGDVQAAYDNLNSRPYLVWVHDFDAKLTTVGDRRLQVATFQTLNWLLLNPQPLPPACLFAHHRRRP